MDARAKRWGVKRDFAALVRTLAETAQTVERVLNDKEQAGSTAREELQNQIGACASDWPVERRSGEEVAKTTALLVVLRQVVAAYSGARCADWSVLSAGGEAAWCLARVAEAAENVPQVGALVEGLKRRLGDEVPALIDAATEESESAMPLNDVYQQLLASFDRRERSRRGVFHTPRPIVRWMVEAADWLALQYFPTASELRIVDMGCGCGSFLHEARERFGTWSNNGKPHLSCLGYEVLPAATAMALWTLSDHRFVRGQAAHQAEIELQWSNPLLCGDAERSRILRPGCQPIIIGNPPYANFGRGNRGPWIDGLLQDYKRGLSERKANLDDDFIKFMRWGQHWIDEAGRGILAVVTSSTYLRGITHRRMRQSLLDSFDRVYMLDLHGDLLRPVKQQKADQNVFGVRSGVSIGLFVKSGAAHAPLAVCYAEKTGSKTEKFEWLNKTPASVVRWEPITPQEPDFSFCRRSHTGPKSSGEYDSYWPLTRIFKQWISGVQSKNDALFVDFNRDGLASRIRSWLEQAPGKVLSADRPQFDEDLIQPYLLAPFDRRWIYYDPKLLGRARYQVMRHMLQPNSGLVFMRQSTNTGEYDHFLAVDCLVSDRVFFSRHGAPYLAPLWLYPATPSTAATRHVNFTDDWLAAMEHCVGPLLEPESLFDYIYGVTFGSAYREHFSAELRVDFPRIPLPQDSQRFVAIAAAGRQMRQLHLNMQPENDLHAIAEDSPTSLGGYVVLKRWHKPRRGRELTPDEVEYLSRLKRVLAETRRLRQDLDKLT